MVGPANVQFDVITETSIEDKYIFDRRRKNC